MCYTGPKTDTNAELYTQKELVVLDISIAEFHEKFYIIEIQKMEFHIPHVGILGAHHYGKQLCETSNHQGHCKISCFFMIIHSYWLPVFITKYNLSIMLSIYWYVLKSLY